MTIVIIQILDPEVVPSPLDCQTHCRSHAECRYFTFYRDTNKCYRKTTNEPTMRTEAVSGPRDCRQDSGSSATAAGAAVPLTTPPPALRAAADCSVPGVVCLQGGAGPHEGAVMVGGRPVCDDGWDRRDGRVVCRELGYPDVVRTYSESYFGRATMGYAMDNVACTGRNDKKACLK